MLERLQNTTICKGLADEEVRRVAAMVRLRSYSSGATVCRQGESGSSMFIVASGRVCATVAVPGDLTPRFIDYRGPGDHFGEMALIGGGRRTATIESVADSELLELDRSAFQELLGEVPRFAALVHESDSGAKVSSVALIGYVIAKDFGRPSSNIRFRMLHAISASASCDSG
jgi:CRP-like cAMP-binding protein